MRSLRIAGVLLGACLVACRDEPGEDFAADSDGAVYVVSSTVFGDEGDSTTYFAPLTGLSAEVDFARDQALEAPGMAKLYAREGLGWFALGSGEEPTVTRYDLDEAGRFVERDAVSFQPRGTSFMSDTMVFVSDSQAYYFDAGNDQLIRWNPTAMEVDGVIDLSAAHKSSLNTIYDVKPLLRDDGMLLFPVAWRNFETDGTFPGTGLFVIDTSRDEVVTYSESMRCQGVTWSATTPAGDLYAGTTPYYAVRQRVTEQGPAACVLRVRAGDTDFDPDFRVDLAALVGGRVAGGLARGREGELFVRVIEPDVEINADSDVSELWSGEYWRWQRCDLAANTLAPVDELPPSAAGGLTYDVDGHVYATDSAADFSQTTLIDLTAPDGPTAALSAPGYIYGVARVR